MDSLRYWLRAKWQELPVCSFYHDLNCLSGLGDRLVDVWAVTAIADLHQTNAKIGVLWERNGDRPQGMLRTYDTDLIRIDNCTFIPRMPKGSVKLEKYCSDHDKIDECFLPLPAGAHQIVLRQGHTWGNSCADKLHRDAKYYHLATNIGFDQFVTSYRKAAKSTKPAEPIARALPDDLQKRVGVHVRLTDKVVADENETEMTKDTWRSIEAAGMCYIDRCIEKNEGFFVCSDDPEYRGRLVKEIRQRGGDVIDIDYQKAPTGLRGCEAIVDFFALTRCARILKMTKYSTFSIAAAIAGNKQLIHLADAAGKGRNRLDIWRSTLDVLDFDSTKSPSPPN